MKLVGLLLVRDEADIVELTIRHLLRIGVDEVLVADNGSSDGTSRILQRLARSHPVRWHAEPGTYRQSEITTGLAVEAHRRGATWVLPTDADEFWWSAEPLRTVLASADAGAVSATVVNFVQHRRQQRRTSRALRRMRHRVDPITPPHLAQQQVASGAVAFVETGYVPKWISRATPTLVIGRGNHAVSGVDGPLVHRHDLAVLHAPLRAAHVLESKAELGRRVRDAGFLPGESWHTIRWSEMAKAEFAVEWAANSHRRGHLDVDGRRRRVVPDDRLRQAVLLARRP